MPPDAFSTLFRYAPFLFILFLAAELLYGRSRARELVTAGRATQEEVDGFIRGAALLFGSLFLIMGLVQLLQPVLLPCLMIFPPRTAGGIAYWTVHDIASAWLIWWLWVGDGGRLLAVLAPAFMQGPVLERQFSPRTVQLAVTAVTLVAPIGTILVQSFDPVFRDFC